MCKVIEASVSTKQQTCLSQALLPLTSTVLYPHSSLHPNQSLPPRPLANALFHVLSYFSTSLPPSLSPSLPHPHVSWPFCRPTTFLGGNVIPLLPIFPPRVVRFSHSNNERGLKGAGQDREQGEEKDGRAEDANTFVNKFVNLLLVSGSLFVHVTHAGSVY